MSQSYLSVATLERLYADATISPIAKLLMAQLLLRQEAGGVSNEDLTYLSQQLKVTPALVCRAFNELIDQNFITLRKEVSEGGEIVDVYQIQLKAPQPIVPHQVVADDLLAVKRQPEPDYSRLEQLDYL